MGAAGSSWGTFLSRPHVPVHTISAKERDRLRGAQGQEGGQLEGNCEEKRIENQ
jgi:hypothetical protein